MAQNTTISIAYKIEGVGNGFQKLTVDADAFRKLMEATVTEADKLKKSFMDFATISNGLKNLGGAVNGLSSVLSEINADYVGFDKAMKAANTMAGKNSEGFRKLKDEISEMAKQLPIARDELANGLYQVISNGVPEDNWLEYLQASARSAVGGIADINKVVGVTSTVIKNYGLEWGAAADIQDKIQLTAKNGVTSFEQLAQALPRVTGNAATLGVSVDELMGTFATLTGVSGNTAEVSTQLAAIFTALVKPSSEASKMAAQMGIQFDAAAIKASGGFQQFLKDLDQSIKTYSQANGLLEQEVYGKLFGSAESLRALIPLQGELAEKFSSNVAAMVDSAGTMEAAFNDMSSTGEAVTQMLKNKYAAIMDIVAGVTSATQPYVTFTAALVSTASNAFILAGAMKKLTITQHLMALRTTDISSGTKGLAKSLATCRLFISQFCTAVSQGTKGLRLFATAWRGMLISTGIGVAIAAVTAIIAYFALKTEEASNSVEKLDDATDEYTQAAASAKIQIEKDVSALQNLIKAKKDTTETIQHLNETYGELFGSHKTENEWLQILTEKSQLYIKQMGYQAQARALMAKVTEASIKKEMAAERMAQLEKDGKAKTTVSSIVGGSSTGYVQRTMSYEVETEEYKQAKKEMEEASAIESEMQKKLDFINGRVSEMNDEMQKGLSENNSKLKVSEMTWQEVADAIEKTEKALKNTKDVQKIKELSAYNQQLKARKKLLDGQLGLETKATGSKKKKLVADPKTKEDIQGNIDILSKKLTGEDTAEQKAIIKDIALLKEKLESIESVQQAASRPTELNSLENINNEISYQRSLRSKASKENIAEIDAEIERLEALADEIELASHMPLPIEEIKSYKQLNKELSYYNTLLDNAASETERLNAQKNINQINDLKKKWDKSSEELKKPADISSLDTIEKLDEAISYYQARQKEATGDEIHNIQKTIDAHERKRVALQRGIEIPSMLREADEINKLTGKEYKIKIGSMGFDELTAKIKELQKMLDDVDHPVTESQRKDIVSLIGVYEQWRKEGVMTFDTFRNGWGTVKSLGDGVESLTQSLQGNGNAWQTITGIVDGFLQIYDGIKTIVTIIDMLSMATTAHTAAKTAEAVAVGTATGAQAAEAITAEANATAQEPVIAANKLATASYMELAAAAYFAAHASIPLAGFGIASGFVTAATSIVEGIGVMPFADGGIVSGPTLGLVGEYAGARNNPEVIAPLDKLRAMIEPSDTGGGKVVFKIDGRTLVGILEKETNLKYRT